MTGRTFCAAFVAVFVLISSSHAGSGRKIAMERLIGLEAERIENHRTAARVLEGLDDQALRALFVNEPRGSVVEARRWESIVQSALTVWVLTKDERYRELTIRAYRAALGELLEKPEEFFWEQVTSLGSVDHRNNYPRPLVDTTDLYALRDACAHFAALYYLTGEKAYARKSAILLARFAEEVPKWPVYYPTRINLEERDAGGMIGHMDRWYDFKAYSQRGPGMNLASDATGPWGIWYYEDIEAGLPLARAYDLIHHSGVMQELGALEAIEAMLRGHVEFQQAFPETFSNMDGVQKIGILIFAEILGEPEWYHDVVWWLGAICKTQFYADGWWQEGSSAYHPQIFDRLPLICRRHLQGYSDPPGFVSKRDGTRFDNLDVLSDLARPFARSAAVLPKIAQPNGLVQVLGDTHFGQRTPGPAMTEARPVLFGCRGHAILGTGRGDNMAQASLSFGGAHGHDHGDGLNLILFAKGKELISETTYSPMFPNTTRDWHTMTAGHATVIVNERQQTSWVESTRHEPTRRRQPEDDVPGVPDWPWRWAGHGNVMNDGFLRLFNTDFDRVQVVEADAERRYGSLVPLQRYRRTIALVKISDEDVYVVDIFRVKGGQTHDYMLHSCLDVPHTAEVSFDLPQRRDEPLYKYITGVRGGMSNDNWHVTFTMDDGSAKLRTYMLAAKDTQVLMGDAPAMRRDGTAPFLAVRRTGGDSVYVAVHHPYVGEPLIRSVEAVDIAPSNDQAVAIRVTLPDRVDTIISTADASPWKVRRTLDRQAELRGRFAHIAEGSEEWSYLVDGAALLAGRRRIQGSPSHEGVLTRTSRIEAGDEYDAFITRAPLPIDGSLDGRTLMIDLGGLIVQSFQVARVERRGGETIIHTHDEPGMTIRPGLVKLEYFPCWGIRGEARFRIPGTALTRVAHDQP